MILPFGWRRGLARAATLLPLFLVSMVGVGAEIALTRYFAVSSWSEYGYWVISIVMAGFALSGVVLALARDAFVRRASFLLPALPTALIVTAVAGYFLTTINPFNPLQLQNPATYAPQLGFIALYFACLLPFFFLTGLFIGLTFVTARESLGRVYGADLTGAGVGALLLLLLARFVHPFELIPALLPGLALAAVVTPGRRKLVASIAAIAALVVAEAVLLLGGQASINEFKGIYAPLHTPGAAVRAEIRLPRGVYALLDDFTEHDDVDVSNDAGMLGLPGPPASLGLYRDGNRIASLPKPGPVNAAYAGAALDAGPYGLLKQPRVLLIGGSGGFRPAEALALGAGSADVVESEPVLGDALRRGLGPSPPLAQDARVTVLSGGPLAAVRAAASGLAPRYDLIDIASDFLDAGEANASALTAEAIADDLRAVRPEGVVSIPVSIRDFPVYALRMLSTVRMALDDVGLSEPAGAHVIVYRSAWNARVLVSRAKWGAAQIDAIRSFCNARSFDLSFYQGIDVAALRTGLFNDLPAVSFRTGSVTSGGPDDAIADEAEAVMAGQPTPSAQDFNLSPMTRDRPFYYAVLRLDDVSTLLRRIEILPQPEIAALVNLAVLAQAAVIALGVLQLPLVAGRRIGGKPAGFLRAALYFPALGLGFLFIEIALIERASFWLEDRASAFALVLTGMLIFSGLGSLCASRFVARPWMGLGIAVVVVMFWTVLATFTLEPLMLATIGWPWLGRAALLLAMLAPASIAVGLPFPLGLTRVGGVSGATASAMLPWAWALNGAFSVVATPLANLLARDTGLRALLLLAAVLYGVAAISFPTVRARPS